MGLYNSHHRCAPVAFTLFTAFVRTYTRPRVEGLENIPSSGAFILAPNHSSHADTAVIFTVVPNSRHRLVAAAARDYFFTGNLMQTSARMLYNIIPVEREAQRGRDPLRHVQRALREGYGVLIYPEGTRSRDGKVGPFRGGIGRLIRQFPEVPVLPVYIEGTTRVMPKGKVIPRPGLVFVKIGTPMHFRIEAHNRASEHAAAEAVRAEVLRLGGLGQA
jgi:1-acyl-sn-glycerol-3-phosphate acyltransferase